MHYISKALPNMVFQNLQFDPSILEIFWLKLVKLRGKACEFLAKLTKIGKILQNIKNKYTNVYLIRSSMENGLNKYIYKK